MIFAPKKESYLIDRGVIIPGINDGKDEKDEKVFLETKKPVAHLNQKWRRRADTEGCTIINHPHSHISGQNRKYVGAAPDIGAYEYGDYSLLDSGISGTPIPVFPYQIMDASGRSQSITALYGTIPTRKDYSNTKATCNCKRTWCEPYCSISSIPIMFIFKPLSRVEPITGL